MEIKNSFPEALEGAEKKVSAESLAADFALAMQGKKKIYRPDDLEQRIKFLIGAFLEEKGLLKRENLDSEEAKKLIEAVYDIHMSENNRLASVSKPVFSDKETRFMIQGARLRQLGEKSHGKLCAEGERDIFGQTVREFDEERDK